MASQTAAHISSLLPRRATVSLEFQNLSGLTATVASNFRGALEAEMRKAALEMAATAAPELHVRVTVSQNARGNLVVLEAGGQTVLLPWSAPPAAESKPRLRIVRTSVWEAAEPILDFALLDSGARLLVLGTGRIASYRLADSKWTDAVFTTLSLDRPIIRDPRGRLEVSETGVRALLPGVTCTGPIQPPVKMTCTGTSEWWRSQVRWVTNRNYLESEALKVAFYSAGNGFLAGIDGKIQDRSGDAIGNTEGWGSDLAISETTCGPSSVVLATRAGSGPEQVQAFEIVKGQATEASEPFALPGPVTALWPAETPGQTSAIVRNSKTGNYEASRLGLACAE